MTTRRGVLIGLAGVAAAAAVPVEAIAKATDSLPTWTNVYYSGMKVGDIISIAYDGSVWRVVSEIGELEPLRASDLEEGAEYTLHLT